MSGGNWLKLWVGYTKTITIGDSNLYIIKITSLLLLLLLPEKSRIKHLKNWLRKSYKK